MQSAEYWEIIDRGLNFDYLSTDRRDKLEQFFGWFSGLPARPLIYTSQLPAAPGGEGSAAVPTGSSDPAPQLERS